MSVKGTKIADLPVSLSLLLSGLTGLVANLWTA